MFCQIYYILFKSNILQMTESDNCGNKSIYYFYDFLIAYTQTTCRVVVIWLSKVINNAWINGSFQVPIRTENKLDETHKR